MAESDYDGNTFGRVAALAIIVSAGLFAATLCGPYSCPVGKGVKGGKSHCAVSNELRDAVSDTVSAWKKAPTQLP